MSSKKGEMSIALIVSIVIAVAILVLIIVGISSGWSMFVKNTPQDISTIDVVVRSCNLACTSGQTYNYCGRSRKLVNENNEEIGTFTCSEIAEKKICKDATGVLSLGTCNDGVTIGLEKCTSIAC